MINKVAPGKRSDEDCRHARPVAPDSADWRRDVIPAAAVFVVRDDDQRVFPIVAMLNAAHQVGNVLLPLQQGGVSGMLIVGTQSLDKSDRGQTFLFEVGEEAGFILQVRRRYRVTGAVLEWSVVVVIGKGLVVPLEQ